MILDFFFTQATSFINLQDHNIFKTYPKAGLIRANLGTNEFVDKKFFFVSLQKIVVRDHKLPDSDKK